MPQTLIGTSVGLAEKQDIPDTAFVGSDLVIGETIFAGAACHIASFDSNGRGIVMMSGGAGYTAITDLAARVDGFATVGLTYNATRPPAISLVRDVEFVYLDDTQAAFAPVQLYLDNVTKGRLNTTQTIANARPCALAVKRRSIRAGFANY